MGAFLKLRNILLQNTCRSCSLYTCMFCGYFQRSCLKKQTNEKRPQCQSDSCQCPVVLSAFNFHADNMVFALGKDGGEREGVGTVRRVAGGTVGK